MSTEAIILAAGMGTRLGRYTENLPKCMLPFLGRPLIDWQVQALRHAGIDEISIVRGFAAEKIQLEDVRYYLNPAYAETNMVGTLMSARERFCSGNDIIVAYADIIYEPRLLAALARSQSPVSVLADDAWIPYWKARSDSWQDDVESLLFNDVNRLTEIGTPRCSPERCQSRYIGLLKFSPAGAVEFTRAYEENERQIGGDPAPWRQSRSFRKAYMTCMIQELIERGIDVRAIRVRGGWLEFDTEEDYERALQWHREGSLSRFISLPQ